MKLWVKNLQSKVYKEKMDYIEFYKDTIMKHQSFERRSKLMDHEIETNIKYFNPTFYKEFVQHMRLLKKLKANERLIAKKE